MFCPNCGTENKGTVCTNCGNNLQPQVTEKPKKKSIFKKWWFWLIAVVVLLFIIIVASSGGDEGGSVIKGDIKTDSTNVVENVAEYEIKRAFVTTKLESLMGDSLFYEAEAGKEFIVIDADVKNLTSQWADAETLIKASLDIEGITYNAANYVVSEDSIDSYSGLDALATSRMYFAVQVPIGTNTDNMTLTITCRGKASTCKISVSEYETKKEYITLGKEYTDNATMTVKFEKVFFTNRLDPSRTDGYYSYYEAKNGKKYLVTKIKVKNLKGSSLSSGAKVDLYGVGERLITSKSSAVFDGVYKLVAVENESGEVTPKIKISENVQKITNPHFKKIYRFYDNDNFKAIADFEQNYEKDKRTDRHDQGSYEA